jgi:hypothetical protein
MRQVTSRPVIAARTAPPRTIETMPGSVVRRAVAISASAMTPSE